MKKLLFKIILLLGIMILPVSVLAEVDVQISIPLPPPIIFLAPPSVVVIPETYVYAVPEVQEEIFFYNGWWCAHGKGAGIVRATTTEVGRIITALQPFTQECPEDGGMITGSIVGEGNSGITVLFLIRTSNVTGRAGKKINTGKNKTHGVSRVWNAGRMVYNR